MKKSRKIVIGLVILVLLLVVAGIAYQRVKDSQPISYQEYCPYYEKHKTGELSCYDAFQEKCLNSGGEGFEIVVVPCVPPSCPEGALCPDVMTNCQNKKKDWTCECSFLKRWSDARGCTYF